MKKLLLLGIIVSLLLALSGCNGRGDLEVVVYDKDGDLLNDVYVGVYSLEDSQRVDFGYTIDGQLGFLGLSSGIYELKVVLRSEQKLRIRIKNEETTYLELRI